MAEATYTVIQAANTLAIREDSVVALLSEFGVEIANRSPAIITQAEMDTLTKAAKSVKDHTEELSY